MKLTWRPGSNNRLAVAYLLFSCAALILLALAPCAATAQSFDEQALSDTFIEYFGDNSGTKSMHGPGMTASDVKASAPKLHPTAVVNDVVRHWDDFSQDTKKKLSPYILVTDPDESGVRQVMGDVNGICPAVVSESTSLTKDSEHFRVIYTNEGTHAATVDYVNQVLAVAEYSYDTETAMGFPAPVTPPDGLLRIYLCDIFTSYRYYGITWPEEIFTESDTARTHLELDNDYEGVVHLYDMNTEKLLQVTVAHEYFHATQNAVVYSPSSFWIMEATAVWMESYVYPEVKGYITEYLIDRFNYLDKPLDYWSSEDTIGYGNSILFQYITQHVADDSFIYTLWDTMRTTCTGGSPPDWCSDEVNELPLVETLLGNLGTDIATVYGDCIKAMFLKNFTDGSLSYFPSVAQRQLGSSVTDELDHLSSYFYKVDLCGSATDPKQINVSLSGSGGDIWQFNLFLEKSDGSYKSQSVTLASGAGQESIIGYCSMYKTATLQVSNLTSDADNRAFTVTTDVDDIQMEQFTHDFNAGWHMVGTPLQPSVSDPVESLDVGLRLLARFKSNRYITNGEHDPTAPGQAFWLYFENITNTVTVLGQASTVDTVPLKAGWNMISLPFDSSVPWDTNVQVISTGGTYSLGSPEANAYVDALLYSWDSENGQWNIPYSISDGFTISPWEGFSVKALQDCTLQFPAP